VICFPRTNRIRPEFEPIDGDRSDVQRSVIIATTFDAFDITLLATGFSQSIGARN